ncbi:MAG: MG2 domain-containing protein [Bacteroidetes bacterium]|nr:MG2 domain-containing protein [Bacteroidota bacterium]
MRNWVTVLFLVSFLTLLQGQEPDSVRLNIYRQLSLFPQEKVYLMTDKAAYVSGESIWFRAFVTDALSHREDFVLSRFVYVDLIDPNGIVLKHHQIISDSSGVFHNRIELESDIAEGAYMLRAYTALMRAREEYLFEKRIFITDPQSSVVSVEPEWTITRDRNITLSLSFKNLRDNSLLSIETVKIKAGDSELQEFPAKRPIKLRVHPQKEKYIYLSFTHANRQYAKYFPIPYTDVDSFDVSFFPEGGYLIANEVSKVAFKSLGYNGLSEEVTGFVFDSKGKEVAALECLHAGMGFFPIIPESGETYYALCTNRDGVTLRFELPAVHTDACMLCVEQRNECFFISVHDNRSYKNQDLFLLMHIRGEVLYANRMPQRNMVALPVSGLPSGIIQILLFDNDMNPLSERLVFNRPSDFARMEITPDVIPNERRMPVNVRIELQIPREFSRSGSFAVSVTDNSDIMPDSSMTITSYLLLSSELRGNIEDAGYYLSNHPAAANALDALL